MNENHQNTNYVLSVIIPTHNELRVGFLKRSLGVLKKFSQVEVICVDKESSDGTQDLIRSMGAKLIVTSANLRSQRLNLGYEMATGHVVLFHHPRSYLPEEGLEYLLKNHTELAWGGFTHSFDLRHPVLAFTSWYSNRVRPLSQKILYLDHCIFVNRGILRRLSLPLWPEVDIFEDTEFSKRLASICKPTILPYVAVTSAVRFQTNGILRQAFINQALKLGYIIGVDKQKMNRWYEKSISLNSKY